MSNKKALFMNMKNYYEAMAQDVFAHLPFTFHIKNGIDDAEFKRFELYYQKSEEEIKLRKNKKKERKEEPEESEKKPSTDQPSEPSYYKSIQ